MSVRDGMDASGYQEIDVDFAVVSVVATLVVVLALNWRRLSVIGAAGLIRLALIWAAIILGLMLVVQLFGFDRYFT